MGTFVSGSAARSCTLGDLLPSSALHIEESSKRNDYVSGMILSNGVSYRFPLLEREGKTIANLWESLTSMG